MTVFCEKGPPVVSWFITPSNHKSTVSTTNPSHIAKLLIFKEDLGVSFVYPTKVIVCLEYYWNMWNTFGMDKDVMDKDVMQQPGLAKFT